MAFGAGLGCRVACAEDGVIMASVSIPELVADAERLAAPFESLGPPVHLYRCPVHPNKELMENWVGLWLCPHSSHQPNRGDDEE